MTDDTVDKTLDEQAAFIVRTIESGEYSEKECILMVALALRAAKDAGEIISTVLPPPPTEGKE